MNPKIKELLELGFENDIYPPMVHVEYSAEDTYMPESVMIAKRLREYMLAQTVKLYDGMRLVGMLRFDGSVPSQVFARHGHTNFYRAKALYYLKPQENLVTFEWEHSNANFDKVVNLGIEEYIKDIDKSRLAHKHEHDRLNFLTALQMTCGTIIDWSNKCADACIEKADATNCPEEKARLYKTASWCRRVPQKPATTFEEGMQSLYFSFHFLPDSLGRPDQYLYKLYKKDIESGLITREYAKELLQELFVMVNGFTPPGGFNSDKGGESHFVVGGYTEDGEDGFNELSELIVETMMGLPLYRPQVSLRWTKKTPRSVLRMVLDYERKDPYKRIAFVNDEPRIEMYMKRVGLSFKEASRYIMCGCNEPTFPGAMSLGGSNSNVARSLVNTLSKNRVELEPLTTFEAFYKFYERELFRDLGRMMEFTDMFNAFRAQDINVLSSLFLDDCVEQGVGITHGGGATRDGGTGLMGYVCVIDSLSIIKQFVYDEKIISLCEFAEILKKDWHGHEDLRLRILRDGRFFGNNDAHSNKIAQMFTNSLSDYAKDKKDYFGNAIMFGNLPGYVSHHAIFGKLTGATPDGRKAGEAFGIGSGQKDGKDKNGITPLLLAVANMDPSRVVEGSSVFNLTLENSLIQNDSNFEKMVTMFETYFKQGGLHIQINYVSREELIDAKSNPKKHQNLRVRVSGFSGYFVRLNEDIQNDVINRTQHTN